MLTAQDQVLLTDLEEVVPLMQQKLSSTTTLARTSAQALPWGDLQACKHILQARPTLITASDLIYFNELFAPLLRTLLWLTQDNSGLPILIAYKVRVLAKEEVFWKAFGASPQTRSYYRLLLQT